MVPVTLLYAGLLGLLAVFLANLVLYVRLRGGEQPAWRADATLRVQANFVENVPMGLILLYLLEVAGAAPVVIHVLGASFVVCRLLHAWGLGRYSGANYPRLIGAQGTFLLLSIMGMGAVYLWFMTPGG